MATPTIREVVSIATANAPATVTTGAGTTVNDVLVCFAGNDFDTAANFGAPTGTAGTWTLQATGDAGANVCHLKVWTRPVTTGGAQTITVSPVVDEEVFNTTFVLSGVDPAAFVDGTPAGSSGAASTSHVAPSVSPTTADALLLCGVMNGGGGQTAAYTPPSGMTEQSDLTDGSFARASTASLVLTASGATGTKTFTSGTSIGYSSASIAIKGGAAGPTVDAGADATVTVSTTFSRTAGESNLTSVTARSWTIVSGPAGSGSTIGTAAALSWTPTTTGSYVLRYSATHSAGTSTDDVAVTVINPTPTWVSDRGSAQNLTAQTSTAVALTSPTSIATGNYLIARIAVDNSGASGAAPGCTVTDPRSNTWTVLGPANVDPGAAAAGATCYVAYAKVVTAYQAADSLTFNWGGNSTTAKAVVVEEWQYIDATTPVAVSAVTATGTATGALTISITPTAADQMVYTCLAVEGPTGDTAPSDTDTTSGSWVALTRLATTSGTATSNQTVSGAYKNVTASGAQTWNSTITARDWGAIAVVFAPPAATTTTYTKAGTGAGQMAALGSKTVTSAATYTKTGLGAAGAAALGSKTVTSATIYTKTGLVATAAAALGGKLVQQSGSIVKTGLGATAAAALGGKTVQQPTTSTKAGAGATAAAALGAETVQHPVTSTKAGAGVLSLVAAGPARITTGALWAGSEAGVAGTWVNTAGAVGGTTGDYATWTDGSSSASATLEAATFGAYSVVPNGAPVDAVNVTVRHSENPAAQISGVTAQAYRGATAYGSPQPLTVSSTVHDDVITLSGLTYADLSDLRVRVTATRFAPVISVKTGTAVSAGAAGGGAAVQNSSPAVITTASADGTHFVDQYGQPRLYVGDECWAVLFSGGEWSSGNYQSTWDTYFAQRAAQGYTAVEVSWCSYPTQIGGPAHVDGADWDGVYPFATSMNPSTTANSTFWGRRDYFFASAAANGITVMVNTTTPFLGINDPNVAQRSWTNTQWQNFGTFLGNRYKNTRNILWVVGDDYFGDFDTQLDAWRTALRATGDTHLISIQLYQEATSRQDIFSLAKDPLSFCVHAEWEHGYSYNVSYDVVEKAQIYTPTAFDDVQGPIPAMWADGRFLSTGVGSGQTDDRLERQMIWWALSSGACGFQTGDDAMWSWGSGAPAAVTGRTFYTATMPAITTAFKSLTGWQQLAPDTSSQLVTAGRGTHASAIASGGSATGYTANTDNYVTASRTPDTGSGSSLAVIYCGKAMNITIDQTKMKSGYTVTWIDPVSGATFSGTPGSTYNSATARGNNSAGDPDWVLVLRG